MKRKTEKLITFCDVCDSGDSVFYHCEGCEKDFCYKCQNKSVVGQKFVHSVHCSGSSDCFLCIACLAKPTPKVQAILAAYLKIQQLRNETAAFYADFEKRRKTAEVAVRDIVEKYNIK